MDIQLLSNFVSLTLAAIFAGLAAVQFLRVLRPQTFFGIADSRWRRFLGGLSRVLAALFLALPQTRIWGGALAALIAFFMVVEQLASQRYSRALPGILVMLAIPFALASGPLS